MKNIIVLSFIIILLIINTIEVNSFFGTGPIGTPSGTTPKSHSVTIFGKKMPNYPYNEVSLHNLGKYGIGYFYSGSQVEFCIIEGIKYNGCNLATYENILGIEKQKKIVINKLNLDDLKYKKNGNTYIKINKKIFGPLNNFKQIETNNDGIIFTYENKNLVYGYINGKNIGPYRALEIEYFKNNGIAIYYYENNNWYLKIKNKTYGPYSTKKDIKLTNLGEKGYILQYIKDNKYYFKYQGKEYGPYLEIKKISNLGASGISVEHKEKGRGWYLEDYIDINGNTYGPYKKTNVINLGLNGYGFTFEKIIGRQDRYYANINGKIYGPYYRVYLKNFSNNGILLTYVKYIQGREFYNSYIVNKPNDFKDNLSNKKIKQINKIINNLSIKKLLIINNKLQNINTNLEKYNKHKDIINYIKEIIKDKLYNK